MLGIAATHVHCTECGTNTPIPEGLTAAATPCAHCEEQGQDAHRTEAVAVLPCPDGVTAAMWASHEKLCAAEDHEHKSGNHVINVD